MGNIHSINIGGSTYVIEPNFVKILDKRDTVAHAPSYYGGQRLTASFENNGGPTSGWNSMLSIYGWQGNDYKVWQIGSNADNNTTDQNLYFRTSNSITNNTWHPWKRVITDKDAATSASSIYVTYNPSSRNSYSVPFMDYGHTQNSKIYSDNTFKYNPYTNTLTATKFEGTATNSQQAGKIAIHTMQHIITSGICKLDNSYEVPVVLGGCDCTTFSDQIDADYFALTTDYHPQTNNSNWLRYNFNNQTLKSTNFKGNLIGNATTAITANNANKVKVNVTSTDGNYPLILGPSTIVGGPVLMGNKSLYTNSANNIFYNAYTNNLTLNSGYIIMPTDDKKGIMPSTNNYGQVGFSDRKFWKMHASTFHGNLSGNVTGNLTGRVLPKTTNTTAIETTYTGIAGIEYHSNVKRYQNGSSYYAGTAYGFPVLSNANGVLNIETHKFEGESYYLHQIGFSSDNGLYHRAFNGNNPKSASSTPSNQNGKTWNSIPLGKPSNYGQVRNIEVVTSMPSTPNSYTLYLVLG